ncbi:hypothetical protein Y1Q_0019168 [Alligator mississippiensis]|uniref:Uncharacterized protein n=1 Tax=Alligator mississippiensis TaxID=8496 RepID=A0A151MQ80_ALLMI|nr:hypothetical protein Y1Q_0019168 [Alligator mississippiensis]
MLQSQSSQLRSFEIFTTVIAGRADKHHYVMYSFTRSSSLSSVFQYVEHLFGVGKSTTGEAILEVCGALQDMLVDTVFCIYDPQSVVSWFWVLRFSQCIRDLDRTHIFITCPPHSGWPYYRSRELYSVVLQAVIGTFTHVNIGWVDSMYNAHVFWNSGPFVGVESRCFVLGVKDT